MKIFLTGGTGFVGSHFLNLAMEHGHDVVALRRSTNVRPRVALKYAPKWITKTISEVTVTDMRGCDVVVHLAASGVSPQVATWEELRKSNVLDQFELCETAVAASVRRIVIAGSISEYGNSGNHFPFIPPNACLLPTYPYASSKAAGFCLVYSLAITRCIEFYYGRISAAYGPGQNIKNIWPSLREAAISGKDFKMTLGEQVRDFIRVERVADIFIDVLSRNDISRGDPVVENIGSGRPVRLSDWALDQWKEFGASGRVCLGAIPYRENEIMRYVPEVSDRIRNLANK